MHNEDKFFDVKPYLNEGILIELKEPQAFDAVYQSFGSAYWPPGPGFLSRHAIRRKPGQEMKGFTLYGHIVK